MTTSAPEVWYRFVDVAYASPADEWGESRGVGSIVVQLVEFAVLKHTAKGTWLDLGGGEKRFVLKSATKHFACPTKGEAAVSFVARKRRQISIYRARIQQAERALVSLVTQESHRCSGTGG